MPTVPSCAGVSVTITPDPKSIPLAGAVSHAIGKIQATAVNLTRLPRTLNFQGIVSRDTQVATADGAARQIVLPGRLGKTTSRIPATVTTDVGEWRPIGIGVAQLVAHFDVRDPNTLFGILLPNTETEVV